MLTPGRLLFNNSDLGNDHPAADKNRFLISEKIKTDTLYYLAILVRPQVIVVRLPAGSYFQKPRSNHSYRSRFSSYPNKKPSLASIISVPFPRQ